MGGVTIYLFVTENFLLSVNLLRNSFYTYGKHQIIITNTFVLLKVNLFLVMQLNSYTIEIAHCLSFYTVKIAQISHRFSLTTTVYDIQV